ncbi:MAG: helix-turn-helix transcriptional regulator [Dehalococcoidales bacterium]|nr:helix-turn-helix transcriptional regulator [Dehalococcoidales bacterium]
MRDRLAKKRKGAGFTQKTMAEKTGISLSFYIKIEQGKRNPSLELARDIAILLNATVDEIFFNHQGHVMCHKATGTE